MPPRLAPGVAAALSAIRAASSSPQPPTPRAPSPAARASSSPMAANATLSKSAQEEPAAVGSSSRMTPMKRSASPGSTGEDVVKQDGDAEASMPSTPPPAKKARKPRKPKVKEPIVYVIPDVEKKTTTYKGRLGYACLNTILRKQKPSVFCSRTCRIDTIKKNGMDFLKELGRQNMEDLHKLIVWNAQHNIFFMRMSSEMFPFAAHPDYKYDLSYAEKELKAAGDKANELGMRLTTHPGQFTQLGSPTKKVVENAIADLHYHAEMMTRMGLGKDSVMIIHGGGTYGDKPAALARFRENYPRLNDDAKARLVLENDEICYNADDLLPLCEELNIPFVFDYHHDQLYPSSQTAAEMMPRILATWERKGIKCKQHLSEPRRGAVSLMERRAHSDRCQNLPDALPDDVDLMIEAKDKEQAVFHLFRIYDLQPTIHDSLRPPALEETKQTAGRKSRTPKKGKAVKNEDEDEIDELEAEEEEGAERIEGEGETLVEELPSKPPRKKRMTKKEKEALAAAAEEKGTEVKEEQDGDVKMEDADSAPTPAPKPKKKRMSKKDKEALTAAAGAEEVQTTEGNVKAEEDDTSTSMPAPPPKSTKKRLTKKEKEALAAAAGAEVEAIETKPEVEAPQVEPELKTEAEIEERPAPPRRRSTRNSVGDSVA